MANPTNLYEYYQSQGQSLPSVSERAALAGNAGIQNYSGTASQNQQLLTYLMGSGSNASSNAITPNSLQPVTPLGTIPQNPDNTNYAGMSTSITQGIMDEYKTLNDQYNTASANQDASSKDIINSMNALLGKSADTAAANELAGVNTATADLNKYVAQLADLNSQASSLNREAQAIPLVTQENNRNTGATDRGVAPQDAGALRLNAIKALSIAQQSDIAAAAATGSQLRLNAAKDKAQQIIDLKYKPLEDALEIKKAQYELNKDALSRLDKKRTEALGVALKKEEQDLADKKKTDEDISNLVFTLQKNGASPTLVNAALKAKSIKEIQSIPGISNFLTSPAEKLDLQLKKLQIQKAQNDLNPSTEQKIVTINGKSYVQNADGTYSEPTLPGSGALNQSKILGLQDKLRDIDSVINNKGLSQSVGSTGIFGRGGTLSPGRKQDFIAGVEKLTSDLTLDQLIQSKAQGATFGALSDAELRILASAATKIGTWAIRDKTGKVTGYRASESSFKNELNTIKELTQRAYNEASGINSIDNYLDTVDQYLQVINSPYSQAGYITN